MKLKTFSLALLLAAMSAKSSTLSTADPQQQFNELTQKRQAVFIENRGQISNSDGSTNKDIQYLMELPNMKAYFTPRGVSYVMSETKNTNKENPEISTSRLDLLFEGASPNISIITERPTATKYHIYTATGVIEPSAFEKIIYKNLYPGVDIEFYAKDGKLEYDIQLSGNGNINQVKFKYEGALALKQLHKNKLSIKTVMGTLTDEIPLSYHTATNGKVTPVQVNYSVKGNIVSFQSNQFLAGGKTTIDPVVSWFYNNIGGTTSSGSILQTATSIMTVPSNGDIVIVGYTNTTNFPLTPGNLVNSQLGIQGFVSEYNSSGTLVWSTILGGTSGSSDVRVKDVLYQPLSVIICGKTTVAIDRNPPYAPLNTFGGSGSGFISMLNSSGLLTNTTYVGEEANALAKDYSNTTTFYATGTVNGNNMYPNPTAATTTFGSPQGLRDAFVAKITMAFGTRLGGITSTWAGSPSFDDQGNDIAFRKGSVTSPGSMVVVTGTTPDWSNFSPTLAAINTPSGPPNLLFNDIFILNYDVNMTTGGTLPRNAVFGGSSSEEDPRIAVSPNWYSTSADNSDIYVTCTTLSSDLNVYTSASIPANPTSYQPNISAGGYDYFVLITDYNSSTIKYASYMRPAPGSAPLNANETALSVIVDPYNNCYLYASSSDLSGVSAIRNTSTSGTGTPANSSDLFLARLNPDYSTEYVVSLLENGADYAGNLSLSMCSNQVYLTGGLGGTIGTDPNAIILTATDVTPVLKLTTNSNLIPATVSLISNTVSTSTPYSGSSTLKWYYNNMLINNPAGNSSTFNATLPGTYRVETDTPCAQTSNTVTISQRNYCVAGTTLSNPYTAPIGVTTYSNQIINFNTITIPAGAELVFNNCTVVADACGLIDVIGGGKLTATNTAFGSCSQWKGIRSNGNGSSLNISSCWIENAVAGVNIIGGGTGNNVNIIGSTFYNNNIHSIINGDNATSGKGFKDDVFGALNPTKTCSTYTILATSPYVTQNLASGSNNCFYGTSQFFGNGSTYIGFTFKDCSNITCISNSLTSFNKGIEYYNNTGTSSPSYINLNRLLSCNKGVIISYQRDPIGASSAFNTNTFTQQVQLQCNFFKGCQYGIVGSGNLMAQGSGAQDAGNTFVSDVAWDLLWQNTNVTPYMYYIYYSQATYNPNISGTLSLPPTPMNGTTVSFNQFTLAGATGAGCRQFSKRNTTGIDDVQGNSSTGIRVYPNPSKESFSIETNEAIASHIEVYDINGRLIYTHKNTEGANKIDINSSSWNMGIYFIKVYQDNQVLKTVKMMKE